MKFYAEGLSLEVAIAELTGPIRVAGDSAAFSFNVFFNGMKLEVIDVFGLIVRSEGKRRMVKSQYHDEVEFD